MSSYRETFGAEMGTMNSPDRARQFLPFAALAGFEGYIDEEQARLAAAYNDAPSADCGGFVTEDDSQSWDLRRMCILNAEHSSKKERDAHGKPSGQSQL